VGTRPNHIFSAPDGVKNLGRNQIGFLSLLPELGKCVGRKTHSWRYGLLAFAAPQLQIAM
jgi:hypothetical protein